MPELPEVELARALVEASALGREIIAVDDRDTRCGAELARSSVGGRTTWWCPAEQR